jgi:hypothetical protein
MISVYVHVVHDIKDTRCFERKKRGGRRGLGAKSERNGSDFQLNNVRAS